jgi:serine/threonine protein kinase
MTVVFSFSPHWMAPENWSVDECRYQGFYCQKPSDVYSLGMVLWELADGKGALPWGSAETVEIRKNVTEKLLRPAIPPATPAELSGLIEVCWRDNPMHRPSSSDVLVKLQDMARKVIFFPPRDFLVPRFLFLLTANGQGSLFSTFYS